MVAGFFRRVKQVGALGWSLALGGCPFTPGVATDAATDALLRDDGGPSDRPATTAPEIAAVDFTVSGCASYDPVGPRCSSKPPARLTFAPIATANVSRFLWDFGDGTARSSERMPMHTYALPGTYDVTLFGASPVGTISRVRIALVAALANELGDACDVDAQCATPLTCLCGTANMCRMAFTRGTCSRLCSAIDCGTNAACADLSAPAGTRNPEPWQGARCVRACSEDRDCNPDHRCRLLPSRPAGTWLRGCFPDLLGEVGDPCRGASGLLQDDACLSGRCADIGGLGLCTTDCRTTMCPGGGACAEFNDGRFLCLRTCLATFACNRDPLLACSVADGKGPLGFQVTGAGPDVSYCGPRRCSNSLDCGPSGVCKSDGTASQCVRRGA